MLWSAPVTQIRLVGRDKEMASSKRSNKKRPPPGGMVPKVALSYEEAAWSLGISRSKLYRLVSEGRLPCVEIDGNTLLLLEDLERFVAAHKMLRGQVESAKREG